MHEIQAGYTTYYSRLRTGNQAFVNPYNLPHSSGPNAGHSGAGVPVTSRSGRVISFTNAGRNALSTPGNNYYDGDDDDDITTGDGSSASSKSSDGKPEDPMERYQEDLEEGLLERPPQALIQKKTAAMTKHTARWARNLGTAFDSRAVAQLKGACEQEEVLIPIRLDLDTEGFRLKDNFTWNMNEELITPDIFAQILCQDLDIPSTYHTQISQSIRSQIEEYAPVAEIQLPKDTDFRVIVNLSLHFSRHLLRDMFEWNLTTDLTPELFSKQLCADLGLSGEFYPAIAHGIHETTLRLKKEACEGYLPQYIDNKAAFGEEAGIRIDQEGLGGSWAPVLETLSREEMKSFDMDRDRQLRRLRRETSKFGGGVGGGLGDRQEYGSSALSGSTTLGGRRSRRRSLSPSPMDSRSASPAIVHGQITGTSAATLSEYERSRWRCSHCAIPGPNTPFARRGPKGNKTLCNACGIYFARHGRLPDHRFQMFAQQLR